MTLEDIENGQRNEPGNDSPPSGEDGSGEESSEVRSQERESEAGSESKKEIPQEEQEWGHVEFTPQQQRRFNRMYAQVKDLESRLNLALEDNKVVFQKLNEYNKRSAAKEYDERINNLKAAKRAAMREGEYDEADKYDDELEKVRAEQLEASKEEELKPKAGEVPEQELPPEVIEKISIWTMEKDAQGNLLRPYAANDKHPQHAKFRKIVDDIINDPDYDGLDEDEYFKIVDNVCEARGLLKRSKPARQQSNVLSNQAGVAKKGKTIQLSRDEMAVATKMGLTKEEYYEAKYG